jgi:opacity protein-like surface antigen
LGAGNFATITTLSGPVGVVGIRYYWQDNWALRLGVGFSSTSISGASNNPSAFAVLGGIQYNYSMNGPVVAYLGGQASFGSNKVAGATESQTTFGIAALAGVEWFAWSNVSLAPEYQLMYTNLSPGGGGSSTSMINLGSVVSFTLGFYF